ncbi:maleylpyruvate isomerase family mycothiol-dependent enzyme [Streptomyces sp. DT24]|uniref:maleylpyruvate isomerase family mycothiol-dependent enzyme n=1 Tax=Streptomyces sp. DT24 TaxID=3416520 RepID=UPI003CF33B98
MTDTRDPELPGVLLRTERDALIPLLRDAPESAFALRTACPGWTVRHVLAHCGAALNRLAENRLEQGVFTPESNDRDIAERADWPIARVVDELERGMTEAGPMIAAAGGVLDRLALGEWVHAGDVREAFGVEGAYAGPGLGYALGLLTDAAERRETPLLIARLDGQEGELTFGVEREGRPAARYAGDGATLIRLYAGRPLVGTRYELEGVRENELIVFA